MNKLRTLVLRLNTKGIGFAGIGTAVTSALAGLTSPDKLGAVLHAAGLHVNPLVFIIVLLLIGSVIAYFGMPASVKAHLASEFPMSAAGKFIGPILADALALAEADKPALLAQAKAANVTIAELGEKAVLSTLDSAKLGFAGDMLKGTIKKAIENGLPSLVAQAGSEEELLFNFLDAHARAFIASIEA